jgi:4-amino-4-deoxy-L-arabinose transferase-like glycosyltransferase
MTKIIKFYKKYQTLIILAILTLGGLLLRLAGQPKIPWGFHRDEANILYNAWSIITTGKDEWGNWLPLHFQAFGDYPPGVYHYLIALLIPIFGISQLTARLPAITFGAALIPLTYFLIRKWFPKLKRHSALIGSLVIATLPWDLVQSRASSEATVALFFGLLAIYFWKKLNQQYRRPTIALFLITTLLSLFSYNAAKLALPLILTLTTLVDRWPIKLQTIKKAKLFQPLLLLGVIWLLAFTSVFANSQLASRWSEVSNFSANQNLVNPAYLIREGNFKLPIWWSRVIHNKPQVVISETLSNYLQYFSGQFLFFRGGLPMRYSVPSSGLLLLTTLPLLLVGAFQAIRTSSRNLNWRWLLLWILIAPIVAAVTREESPNVRRALFFIWPLIPLVSLGWQMITDWLKKISNWLLFGFYLLAGLVFAWEVGSFLTYYTVQTAYETIESRSYGYFQTFAASRRWLEQQNAEAQVVMMENNDTPYIYYLLSNQVHPRDYQPIARHNPENLFLKPWDRQRWSIGRYQFWPGACPNLEDWQENTLYILQAEACDQEIRDQWEVVKIIHVPGGDPKFALVEAAQLTLEN